MFLYVSVYLRPAGVSPGVAIYSLSAPLLRFDQVGTHRLFLSRSKCAKGSFTGMEIRNSAFTAIITPLTPNTFALVVTDPSIRTFDSFPSSFSFSSFSVSTRARRASLCGVLGGYDQNVCVRVCIGLSFFFCCL